MSPLRSRHLTAAALTAAALAAVALAALAPAAQPAPMPAAGVVAAVPDGDTLRVRVAGVVRTVDLAGIDAPELGSGACFAKAAHRRLRAGVAVGGTVRFQFVGRRPGATAKRFAALVRVGNVSLNRRMVIGGFARIDGADRFPQGRALIAAESAAQDAARGLWRVCEGLEPAGGTTGTSAPATPGSAAPAPSPPAPPAPATPTPAQLTAEFTTLLTGRTIRAIRNGQFSSSERRIQLCAGNAYREEFNEIFSAGGSFTAVTGGSWSITATEFQAGVGAAARIRLDAEGSDPDADVTLVLGQGGVITLNGGAATILDGATC